MPELRFDKFGALCPCQAGATGDFNLDIAFSDHRFLVRRWSNSEEQE